MLLQERDYRIYRDGEIEDDDQLGCLMEHRDSAVSLGLSGGSSYVKIISSRTQSSNKLRRSTVELSSFNSLGTTSSDSSSYCVSTPTRKASTIALRYRGTCSTTSGNPSSVETSPKQSLVQRGKDEGSNWAFREVREAAGEVMLSGNESSIEPRSHQTASGTTLTEDDQSDWLNSAVQFFLEVIVLGYLVVPFLELTILIERYFRSKVDDIQRSTGYLFASLFAPSSSLQDEPGHFESGKFYSTPNTPMLQHYQQQLIEGKEDISGVSPEAISCFSASSASEDSTSDEDDGQQDGWGHFTDFQDELADETSFVPFCSAGPVVTALEPLAEGREEDDDAGEDWTF